MYMSLGLIKLRSNLYISEAILTNDKVLREEKYPLSMPKMTNIHTIEVACTPNVW